MEVIYLVLEDKLGWCMIRCWCEASVVDVKRKANEFCAEVLFFLMTLPLKGEIPGASGRKISVSMQTFVFQKCSYGMARGSDFCRSPADVAGSGQRGRQVCRHLGSGE